MPDAVVIGAGHNGLVAANRLADAGFVPDAVHGVRVFTDLVPGSLLDLEPGATAALVELEQAVAAAEGSTYAPNLDASPGLGSNDTETSARSAIIPIVNGATGVGNPNRQGLNSALRGEGDPLNINQDIPGQGNGRYSPVWDVHPVVWTRAAIASGQRTLLVSGSDVANAFTHGLIVSAGNGPANASLGGLPAGGFISNCPIIAID